MVKEEDREGRRRVGRITFELRRRNLYMMDSTVLGMRRRRRALHRLRLCMSLLVRQDKVDFGRDRSMSEALLGRCVRRRLDLVRGR